MIGWFTWFREKGAPTFYGDNRTPVTIDQDIISLLFLFIVLSISYLLILPGIKHQKFSSSFAFLFTMLTGGVLLVSIYHPCWHRAEMHINTAFKSRSIEKTNAKLTVRIGLRYMNVSLSGNNSGFDGSPLKYNERFTFNGAQRMEDVFRQALKRGLPYPILKVVEYMSCDGFAWGRQYRVAGHYTATSMWLASASWLFSLICLFLLPHMFAHSMLTTGILILTGDLIFIWNIPRGMKIGFEVEHRRMAFLNFRLSICYHATLAIAVSCIVVGILLWWMESTNIYHFDTIFTAKKTARDSVVDRPRLKTVSVRSTS